MRQRIEHLKAEAAREPNKDINTEHVRIYECPEDNRIYFQFKAGKPSKEVCQVMRRNGWRWKRSVNAWSRHLNNAGRYKAEYTEAAVDKMLDQAEGY